MRHASIVAATFLVALVSIAHAQADLPSLVARAGAYVESFQRNFGSMVAEERYEQAIRQSLASPTRMVRGAAGPARTVLVSDFLLVQVPGEGWMPFRDVFERDGEKVRDREERLAALFLTGSRTAFDQARTIMTEGARYNIGNVNRNINVPTLPLQFLTPAHRARFSFTAGKRDDELGVAIEYRETSRPTYISTTGGRDLPVYGRFWVDEQTGTIRRTELHAVDTGVEAHIMVTYEHDAGTDLWVPIKMEERYRRARDPAEVYGVATYSRFRRFQVTTSEEVAR
jgi:outer membrane lipoprotein-sorting protein